MEKEIMPKGITSVQAEKLLIQHGLNEIKEVKSFTLLKAFFSQFDNFLIWLLIAAGGISFAVGERLDSIFIFLIVLLNAVFGIFQEFKAEKALSSLKNMTVTKVRVIRDAKEKEIDSKNLVPGDLIYIEEGAKIPADCEMSKSWHLEINEASLTGESMPVVKNELDKANNQIYMGTVVAKGRTYALVKYTGMNTKFGQIAKTLSEIKVGKTPLHQKLELFSKQVGVVGFLAAVLVFILSFIDHKTPVESFIFAVSLAVAIVPEGLPAVLTITLAIGVEKMAKKKAIIRKLNTIETLGTVTVVATDKTGTLTTNKMQVKDLWVDNKTYPAGNLPNLSNHPFSKMILNGILCSTASLVYKTENDSDVIGDATEGAMLILAQKVGLIPDQIKNDYQVVDELAFDPVTKRMTVIVKNRDKQMVFTKGAPESILSVCNKFMQGNKIVVLTGEQKQIIEEAFKKFAKRGLRTLAFSFKENEIYDIEKSQIFLGFVGIADPIRAEIKEAVIKANRAGIKVIMITGDNELTAKNIGEEAGIYQKNNDILTGKQLDNYSDSQLLPLLENTAIFARTAPHHKHRLVSLLQKKGEIVAVTGDGVNDALALKQAHVGVAMGITGTDVAKDTAHMILTDDNFATLISAIEQGRNIYHHIKNAIKYLLTCNTGEVIYVLAAIIFKLPIMTPLQLLYINLVTDGLPAISIAFSPYHTEVMYEKPRQETTLFKKKDYRFIFIFGFLTFLLPFISVMFFRSILNTSGLITVVFSTMIFIQPFILSSLWLSHKMLIGHLKLFLKPVFLLAFLSSFLLQPVLIYHPLLQNVFSVTAIPWPLLLFSLVWSFLILVPLEIYKKYRL